MNPLSPRSRRKGGVLITVIMVLFIAGAMAAIAINYSVFTLKISWRSIARSQAQAIGEGELEAMYYKWRVALLNNLEQNAAVNLFANTSSTPANRIWDNATTPTTLHTSTLLAQEQGGWTIKRSLYYEREDIGLVAGSVPKSGTIAYYTAKVEISSPPPNAITLKIGRTFAVSDASIYQFSILYQNELECNPATAMQVAGQVVCNSSIYVGATGGNVVRFLDSVNYVTEFNGKDYVTAESQFRTKMSYNSTAITLTPPVINSIASATTSNLSALNKMTKPENFVGGVNAAIAVDQYPSAYATADDVFRSLIEPPPGVTEHPTIAERRMYTRALNTTATMGSGLIINVTNSGVTLSYTELGSTTATDVTGTFNTAITYRQTMVDPRENNNNAANGTKLVTDIDVGMLVSQIAASSLYTNFNGIVYIRESSPTLSAIRLKNGASLYPNNGKGLTFVTNTGMYIQGSYNTTPESGSGSVNTSGDGADTIPSALMADAITLLSTGWVDANGSDPDLSTRFADSDSIICAAIVTGNIGSIPTASPVVKSGGVQNLTRLVEDWGSNQPIIFGTLAQLFRSKYYIAPCPNVGVTPGVYINPTSRTFQYNHDMANNPPKLNPSTTVYSRGSFFFW